MNYIFNLESYMFYVKIQSSIWCGTEEKTSKKECQLILDFM